MTLDGRTASLIAVGASVTANCQPCLEANCARAAQYGAKPPEIAVAVEIGRRVRAGAAAKFDDFAAGLGVPVAATPSAAPACECVRS
jgi:AhpD family alkylhydroperoxidase